MSIKNLADKLYPAFIEKTKNIGGVCRLFLSASDMKTRATVKNSSADSPAEAWKIALEELQKTLSAEKIKPIILRADWVVSSEKMTWESFIKLIEKTRRNYFRRGLALDSDYKIAFTETELNGNSMLYKDGKEGSKYCVFRQDRSNEYCQKRFGFDFPTPEISSQVEIFETEGAFVQEDEKPKFITGKGLYTGKRDVSNIDYELFMRLAKNGANYLAKQVQKNGKFVYGVYSCFNKSVPSYNVTDHFNAIIAMFDVYREYKKMPPIKLGKAIKNALDYGVKNFVVYRKLEDGSEAAYVAEMKNQEIKLGATGLALTALSYYTEFMHTKKYLTLMNSLARGIMTMQKSDGSFVHILNSEDFSVKESFRVVCYDGEAVLGMMRLYSVTNDEKLLQASESAFSHFIKINHWKYYDSWLGYAVNELTKWKPDRKYFEFGINNFQPCLPFIYNTDIPFPSLLELIMTADKMLERMKAVPQMSELLDKVNFNDFYSAMEKRAENLLCGYFFPELAMYFENPENIVNSFFIRNIAFRVRIDDVQHFTAGFIAYCQYLKRRKNLPAPVPSEKLLNYKNERTNVTNFKIEPFDIKKYLATIEKDLSENLPEISIEDFKKKFQKSDAEIFFMLRSVNKKTSGLELSSFRRARFFKKHFGINVCLVTNAYQTDILENLKHHELDNNFLNMYDYFQEIDRKNFEQIPAKITKVNEEEKIYRDTYDLGFLSRRQRLDNETKRVEEAIYYRPDGTEALREYYSMVNDKNVVTSVEIIDRNKTVTHTLPSREHLMSHWISSIFNDEKKIYLLIGDRTPEYTLTYIDIKSAGMKNIYVFHQIHSMHVAGVEPFKNRTNSRYKYLDNNALKADGIITCTQRQKEDIVKRYQLNNIFVIPHSMKEFPPAKEKMDSSKIIFVGRLAKEKGPDKVVAAFKIVSEAIPQAHLHFYGAGPMKDELQEKINADGLSNKVFFEGFVVNIADAYSSAALSICTSNIEGFSMAIQESLQMGCPVVSFNCPYGPGDMIVDGMNGYLVPPGNIEALAEKIILILKNPELRKKLSANALKYIEKYSHSVVAKKWASLFAKFLPNNTDNIEEK